ncbi:hypothetical protein Nepgr_006873 [Nepenthes gracilis]|uniref:superoxide dismutase n=1 Tax=Nepenthes gracilis TaxID=150966 RepID=A0AAD3S5X7_NEPGR|nr:hypothetical protein Nepgr_006873 [Nepenthes gracilis]
MSIGDPVGVFNSQSAIKFNGGGLSPTLSREMRCSHINHSIFWKNLTPVSASGSFYELLASILCSAFPVYFFSNVRIIFWEEGGGEPPKGSLVQAIDSVFGSLEALIQKMNAKGAALQGSGCVWLGVDKEFKKLVIETTANQDHRITKGSNMAPLLGISVWEHAYYLQCKNVKPAYLKKI